ncbi:hypothetical protein TTHERM_00929580 (macronuclear) [Tetrahymena thermophila SB210]|uniref:Uncharacterized protein n=1 Tax=Tetrahymena thermophila (strain SB210) TaxID=312017 RepID=Q24CI4_TETTS|nr:hypothetical protein TTHERM_00929580 [Tetrahymena thermophila SB210]EAS05476.3 hypothetical protein TTHERM_00929580 [Tetrahymena thermophila SB210]|eukprot:XP_001025721.3 hypothetical protein TTHERM_00929580 [Tetrahymena thermophila SB210]
MSLNDQEYMNDYLINHKTQNNSNLNTTKLTEISQIMNCIDQKQNYPIFQTLENPSPLLASNYKDNNEQLLQQIEGTPYNLMNLNFPQNNSNLSSLPHTEMKTDQHPYFSNISPVSRFQTKISIMGKQCPVTGSARSSQITPSNSSSVLQQNNLTNPFTPSNILPNKNHLYTGPQTSSFIQNGNNTNNSSHSSVSNSRLNINRNNIDSIKGDENQYSLSNNINFNNTNLISQPLSFNKYQLSQNNNKLFFKNELSPNQKQNASTIKLLAKIKNQDELNYQSEMVQVDQYLSKVYNQKMNSSREEDPPNFGAILAKRTSPPLKGKNIQNSKSSALNSNNSQNQSGILQFTTIQSQNNLLNANNNSISGLANNQSAAYTQINNFQNSSQKYLMNNLNHQSVLNQTSDSLKNKSAFGVFGLKDERSIQESKAYLQAMRALQERIKELEKQLSLKSENEIRLHVESQFQQSLEESSEIIENLNNKNIILEEQIGHLLNEIQQYKNVINEREKEFQQQREEWLKGNSERNAIIESHIQKQSQLSTQLQEEIERNHQLQIEINETQQKWQLLHQEHQLIEAKRIEQLQRDFDDEKSQHNELKGLCVKSSEEIETLLAQNKALDHKLQIREKEFDEYRIQYNQGHVDLLKDQIREQKEYLDKIEDKIKQNYESKLQQLESELNNQRQVEKQLRNEIKEMQKNKLQKQIDQFNQSINSPSSNNKLINNQSVLQNNQRLNQNNAIANDANSITSNEYQQNQIYQQYNQNFNSVQENNSHSELEKYLNPKQTLTNTYPKQQANIINNELSIPQNQLNIQQQNTIQQNIQKNMQNFIKLNNFQSNNQQMQLYQQPLQSQHQRAISNQVNEIENFSLQEESDLLNFDYDELQTQSRINSKNSPNLYSKIQNQIISLDSPLRKRSKNNEVISSSLQITKQFQNGQNVNQYSFMLPNSSHENDVIGSPQNMQQIGSISPFYNPYHNQNQYHQQSPDFKNQNSISNNVSRNQLSNNSKEFQRIQVTDQQQIDSIQNNQMSYHNMNNNSQQQFQLLSQNQDMYNLRQNQNERINQKYQQMQASSYLQYSDAINKELEYKKQALALANKRSKSQNQSQHAQQQNQIIKLHKNSADNLNNTADDEFNQDYPSNQIGQELIRDIFEAESELKLLNQRYEVLLTESRNEENSKKKSEIRKELITINEKIKVLNEKLYVLKKREKFIMNQQFQKTQNFQEQQQNSQQVQKMQLKDNIQFQQQQFQDPYQNQQYNQQ